jgi:hypothetical protein
MKRRNAECFGPQAAACRRRPCTVPGCRVHPCVPHHTRSRGAGGKDDCTIGLCWDHHAFAHDHGLKAFEERFGVDLVAAAAQLAAELAARPAHDCLERVVLREDASRMRSVYVCDRCGTEVQEDEDA